MKSTLPPQFLPETTEADQAEQAIGGAEEVAPWGNGARQDELWGMGAITDAAEGLGTLLGLGGGLGTENTLPTTGGGGGDRPMLRLGSRGDDVRTCQRRLNLKGADLVEDGAFGPKTDGAVRSFQSSNGLAADGVVGPLTWAALDAGLGAAPAKGEGGEVGPNGPVMGLVEGEKDENGPGGGLVPITQPAAAKPKPARELRTQAEIKKDESERTLDEIDTTFDGMMADTTEFAPFVAAGFLEASFANVLALMRDMGGQTQYSYIQAKESLADGSLLGMVQASQRNNLINRRLGPNDPDRAEFLQAAPTANGAVFHPNRSRTKGLILLGAKHNGLTREVLLDLAHELNHLANLKSQAKVEADDSKDTQIGTGTRTAEQMADTRRTFINELVARHDEWWCAQTIRADRLGMVTSDIDEPHPSNLLAACFAFADNAAQTSPGAYDPWGMWAELAGRGDDSMEQQVRAWMPLVSHEQISANPYRDAAAKANFLAASTAPMGAEVDGLGSRIYAD
jgi:hypothetical protein